MLLSSLPLVTAEAKGPKANGQTAKVVLRYYSLNTMARMVDGSRPEANVHEETVEVAKDSVVANLIVKKIKRDVITFQFRDNFYTCDNMYEGSLITLQRGASLELECRIVTDAKETLTVIWPLEEH